MPVARRSFRVGRVKGFLRGSAWYLCYHENGQRRRPRIGPQQDAARLLAAQTNAQLESGAATAMSFEPISIPDLRQRWPDHHEHVLRSSVHTSVAKWRDYSKLIIARDAHVLDCFRAAEFEFRRRLDRLNQPVDRSEWNTTPPTVNAYYDQTENDITFPAGILQPPFFDPQADDAQNYLKTAIRTDPHAPNRFRVMVPLTILQVFYELFGVKSDNKMYRAPDQRAEIW